MQWWLSTCMPFRYLEQSLKVPLYIESTLFCPWDFSGQEFCSGLPFPPPLDSLHPETEAASPALEGRFFTTEPAGKPSDSIQWSRVFHKIFHGHCTGTWCERTLGSWPAWMMTASFQNPLSTYWVLVPSFLECFWKFLIPTIVWNLSFLREMGMYEFGKKGFRIIHYAWNLFLPWYTLPPVRQFLGRLIRSPGSRGGRGKGVVWDSQEGDTGLQF